MTRLDRARDEAAITTLTLLRVGVGALLMAHGWLKLQDLEGTAQGFASMEIPWPRTAAYLALLGEFVGGFGLLIGFLTRLAAFGVLLVMLSAIWFVHLGNGPFAQNGGWELPALLALVALHFVARGAGPFSLDRLAWRTRRNRLRRAARYHEVPYDLRTPRDTPRELPVDRPRRSPTPVY